MKETLKKMQAAKYFVVSSGDSPNQIFFDLNSAVKDGDVYIDAFDENGKPIDSIKRKDGVLDEDRPLTETDYTNWF